jgi:hypothetical protein
MMNRLTGVLGNVLKHILISVERALRAMVITGLIVFLVVGLGTEALGAYFTHELPPSGLTHLSAAALGIAFAYAAAVTVAVIEILRGIIRGIELIVAETEHLAEEGLRDLEGVARRSEEEAMRLGRSALGGAESLEHGITDRFRGAERGVASRLPGHHESQTTTVPTTSDPSQNSTR